MQRERTLVKSLVDLGFTTEQAIELLMHPVHSTSHKSGSSTSTRRSAKVFAAQGRRMGEADVVEEENPPPHPRNLPSTSKGSLMQVIDKMDSSVCGLSWLTGRWGSLCAAHIHLVRRRSCR
jgi:hypothetical protein